MAHRGPASLTTAAALTIAASRGRAPVYGPPMVSLDDEPGPPVEVPVGFDRKPAGAAVGDDGTVACVTCGRRLPLAQADVVGQGYRCPRCTQHASVAALAGGAADAAAHLDDAQREGLHRSGVRLLVGGLAIVASSIIILVLEQTLEAIAVFAGGIAAVSLGVTRMRAAR